MKLPSGVAFALLLSFASWSTVTSRSVLSRTDISRTDYDGKSLQDYAAVIDAPGPPKLDKRKGGGGGGGGRGGGGGGGRSGGSSGGRSGGGGSSGGNRGGSGGGVAPGSRPNSNFGGSSRSGSGPPRSYGGGGFYGGGSSVPYTAGRRSPKGLGPSFLPLAALGFFPGLWLFGAYAYAMNDGYHYYDRRSNRNETIPIICLCQEYSVCGCDDNNNGTYMKSLFKDTDENGLPRNSSIVKVADVNGTTTIVINGTLPNGTTAPDPNYSSGATTLLPHLLNLSGYWPMVAIVFATVALL